MDAALTALNHTESLRLHPRVDTTSANTQGGSCLLHRPLMEEKLLHWEADQQACALF